jgi:hypothetical protein
MERDLNHFVYRAIVSGLPFRLIRYSDTSITCPMQITLHCRKAYAVSRLEQVLSITSSSYLPSRSLNPPNPTPSQPTPESSFPTGQERVESMQAYSKKWDEEWKDVQKEREEGKIQRTTGNNNTLIGRSF